MNVIVNSVYLFVQTPVQTIFVSKPLDHKNTAIIDAFRGIVSRKFEVN